MFHSISAQDSNVPDESCVPVVSGRQSETQLVSKTGLFLPQKTPTHFQFVTIQSLLQRKTQRVGVEKGDAFNLSGDYVMKLRVSYDS